MRNVFLTMATLAMLGTTAAAGAVTLVNGSFELGTNPGSFSTQNAGSTAITGWTVGGAGVDYIGSYWQASDGVRSLDLSALSAGSVSQSFATTIGQAYTVTFDLSGNPDAGPDDKISVVSISGSLPAIQFYTVGAGNSRDNMNWETYSYSFTAFDVVSSLTFASANYTPFGPALDNVSVTEFDGGTGATVPEPASWALMLIGFGFIGASARSRRKGNVVAA